MFEGLSDRLSGILSGLTRRGALTEADVTAAMREVRRALLEADVALEVVRGFVDRVREKAVGATVLKSVTPGQMVVKIVNDELVAMLGAEAEVIDLNAPAPVAILMVGLQGSGKTTTTAKIAKRLNDRSDPAHPEEQRDRWARYATITRLEPVALVASGPGPDDAAAGSVVPRREGSTSGKLPFHVGGRGRRGGRRRRPR